MTTYYDAGSHDFAQELVGKRITDIDTDAETILLEDGTVLIPDGTADCCAWFDVVALEEIDLSDNLVTAVHEVDSSLEDPSFSAFDIVILSKDKTIARLVVDGDVSNGYYCHSIILRVTKKGA